MIEIISKYSMTELMEFNVYKKKVIKLNMTVVILSVNRFPPYM